MKYMIYIAHSPEDNGVTAAICRALEEGRVSCRHSQSDNFPGTERAIAKAIDGSDAVIVILSSAINGSAQVKWEVEYAAKKGKEIVPFRIDTAPLPKYLEFYLSTTHWLDASMPPLENHIAQLVYTVRYLLGLERERAAKKAVAAMILGILSPLFGGYFFGLPAIILGVVELRAIASGRSSRVGRKYAYTGIVCGLIGIAVVTALMFNKEYMDMIQTWLEK